MKKFVSVILFVIVVLNVSAQNKMNYSLFKKINDMSRQSDEISVFVKGDIEKIKTETEKVGGVFKYSAGDVAAVRLPLSAIQDFASKNFIARIEDNDMKLQKLNDTLLINNRVWPVHLGFPPLTQGYDGTGVVMGIIDEGIDLVHQDFKNVNGSTRIKFLWDQRLNGSPGGITPMPYGYGTEWNSIAINNGAASAHQDGPYGHGTHVTGIAAGNGLAVNNYKGVAPGSDIISVAIDVNANTNVFLASLSDAVNYIYSKAQAMGKPAVINVSLGTYLGSHDGQDLQAQVIANLISSQPGRALVCAAGNAGDAPIHIGYDVPADTGFTWLRPAASPPHPVSAYIGIYVDTADMNTIQFAIGADDNVNFSYRGGTSFSNSSALLGLRVDTIWNGTNRLGIDSSYGEIVGGTFSLEYFIQPDSTQYLWRIMTKGSGHIDAWSFYYVYDNLPSSSVMPIITKYQMPDINQNIVSSFTCRDEVITVGSYINRGYYIDVNGNPVFSAQFTPATTPGPLSNFSSHGPTRDGRIKPDITSTGEKVVSTGYTPQIISLLNSPFDYLVAAGGKHTPGSGTSMASPAVAGIAALYFQKNPAHNWQQVKDAILNCARRDIFTGNNLPNSYWGYGKADAFGAVAGCLVGLDEMLFTERNLTVYPNPASEEVNVYYSFPGAAGKMKLKISDIVGRTIQKFY
ncbi:MAG: S8 family serine peptidase [Bacteroidia bacterium]|nr:S8 family serine peptidase [Bacteroidia bacterium]